MTTINMIAAIGKRGQLGINNGTGLPWRSPDDMAFFKSTTMGGALVFGRRTYEIVSKNHMPGRILFCWDRLSTPSDMVKLVVETAPRWPIWIAGGAATYRAFAPLVDGLKIVSVIDYDGPADTWFPFDAYGMKDLRGE